MLGWLASATAALVVAVGPGPQDPVTNLPDVEVRQAPATREAAESFVEAVATRPFGALTLARWETPVCPEIVNLEGEKAELILWRIRVRAAQAGAPMAEGACRTNVSIVMTADGSRTADDFVAASPESFRISPGPTQRSRADLGRFRRSEAPVRWWHTSGLYDTHHRTFISTSGSTPSIVNTDGAVYFNQDRRQAFLTALVIVDVARLEAVDLNTLGDYLALVILAEVDPAHGGADFPSILNLWDTGGVTTLSAWDLGYLRGLYEGEVRISGSGAVETGRQKSEIARRVLAEAQASSPNE